jgi:hypothetical protein
MVSEMILSQTSSTYFTVGSWTNTFFLDDAMGAHQISLPSELQINLKKAKD